ncbi:MAG TPA: nucleotide-binding protein [Candidatus Acidoferrales bacterium]|nr:nucleotide-binding protein [Candidatus Acidoferrales bacterium]
MKRTIFIGSSHEGYDDAQRVCGALKNIDDPPLTPQLDPQLWTTFFDAGSLTFEALEDMLRRCCAAIFIIRRDDLVRHMDPDAGAHPPREGKRHYMPRGNVLVEFGLVAGRLGRRNVALCRLGEVELPSDLAGMTVIEMCPKCPEKPDAAQGPFTNDGLERLRHWASHLLATAPGIERTGLFHGYTGRWELELQLKKWRGLLIEKPDYAIVTGFLDLFMCPEGVGSLGSAIGTLSCRLTSPGSGSPLMADFHVIHTISNIECTASGGLELTSHVLRVGQITEGTTLPAELKAIGSGSEPWTFKWTLNADQSGHLEGTLCTTAAGGTEGDLTASKLRLVR